MYKCKYSRLRVAFFSCEIFCVFYGSFSYPIIFQLWSIHVCVFYCSSSYPIIFQLWSILHFFGEQFLIIQLLFFFEGERNFQCDLCHKSFRQKAHLESHKGIHKVEKIKCTFCERTFNRETDRKLHEKIHTKTGLFQCESCKKTFTKKQNYKRHTLIHTGQKNFHCDSCDKDYYTKYHLQRHKAKCRGSEKYPSMYLGMEGMYHEEGILGVTDKNGL